MDSSENSASSSTARPEDDDHHDLDNLPEDTETPDEKRFREDSQILLKLLPEEIWIKMFTDHFKGTSKEFLDLINSSPVFRSIFASHRPIYLFQLIFPFLQPYLHSYNNSGTRKRGFTLLILRSVCKSWSKTVDSFIHQKSIQNFTKSTRESFLEVDAVQSASFHEFRSNRVAKITAFQNHFFTSHHLLSPPLSFRNPFIGTTLNTSLLRDTHNLILFFESMQGLLDCQGRNILQSKITVDFVQDTFWSRLGYSIFMLKKMPNLEQLHFSIGTFDQVPNKVMIRCCTELLKADDLLLLPDLPKLSVLRLDAIAVSICRPLAKKNAKFVKTLLLPQLDTPLDFQILRISFPNLEHLQMGIETKRGLVSLVEAKRKFRGQPKLKSLVFSCTPKQAFVRWSTVFKGLQMQLRWGGELKKVVLKMPRAKKEDNKIKILEDSKLKRIGLWKVTCLEIEIWNRCHLDFLLPLRSNLEELRITSHSDVECDEEEGEIVDYGPYSPEVSFFGWEEEMERSNIWRIFGMLEKLVICRNGNEKVWCRSALPKEIN